MDAALINPTGRKFPGFTTQELKIAVVDSQLGLRVIDAERVAMMIEEVRRREAGLSKTLHEVLAR